MKINRVDSKHPRLNKFKDSLLGNIFYFICLHWFVLVCIVGIGISGLALLFVAEKLFPDSVHVLGYAMDKRMYEELEKNHHYHAASFILEQNENFLKNDSKGSEYQIALARLYSKIGKFNEAESRLLNLLNSTTDDEIQFQSARLLSELYDEMGDYERSSKYFKIVMDSSYPGREDLILQGLKIKYNSDPTAATDSLESFVNYLKDNDAFSPEFKLKHITQLIDWKLKVGKGLVIPYVQIGLALCESVKNIYDDTFLHAGKLAEQCFSVGDTENGYKLMRLHLNHLSQKYDDDDVERLKGNLLLCRYYQKTGQWDKLTSELIKTCDALKGKIADNFAGLSSQQREYLAASLREPFDMAIEVALEHPSPELANLCFDNLIFERGLLLRADVAQRLAVERNSDLQKTYAEWVKAKSDLNARQYLSGPGNAIAKWELEHKIANLDKQLAKNPKLELEHEEFERGDIQKSLPKNGYFAEFGENDGNLYAIILPKKGDAKFLPLCKDTDVSFALQASIKDIYTDGNLTRKLFNPLLAVIPEGSNVSYSVSGLFSQLSIPAMRLKDAGVKSEHLTDHYQMKLFSSPMAIVDKDEDKALLANNGRVSLWGGIDYGIADTTSVVELTRGLQRGEPLRYLPGSYREVATLQNMLRESGVQPTLHTGSRATSAQFLKESPTVLHISTHGSFDSDNEENPLSSSYLFFANANPSWMNINPTSVHKAGIVNGIDIENMNLSDCKLVVLSACETGLGYSKTREGVYGLQRAFKLAGARSILMSMWSVNDAVTAEYMTAFYKEFLSGARPDAAIRKAQSLIRQRHPSPADWGAFALMD